MPSSVYWESVCVCVSHKFLYVCLYLISAACVWCLFFLFFLPFVPARSMQVARDPGPWKYLFIEPRYSRGAEGAWEKDYPADRGVVELGKGGDGW